jgi:hypothetical protein
VFTADNLQKLTAPLQFINLAEGRHYLKLTLQILVFFSLAVPRRRGLFV